ncbi:DNA-directed RNA polymerase III subunit RPC4-like isoform X2 [Biomphalaria glabrata]|uniref:DNA-directed RNA polymerase III subunit RPC4-like isoform X2 n=1 Tax=Biomphalaria glabrata TaxID=6526 RepID=A0A9W2ZQT2_BIOGL|nr:DNA-directed RNA polymerase III subunit RPC4-like isoform X2 [Biomphalaria glabrata]
MLIYEKKRLFGVFKSFKMADEGTSNNSDIPRGLINRTGNPLSKGSRLPSVRGHRDLTLGGVQRKVFVPNLTAVKKSLNKDDVKPNVASATLTIPDQLDTNKGKGKFKSDRGRGRGRGRGQAEDRTIQLHSEFSYGPMGGAGSSSGWGKSREGGGGGGGGGSGGRNADVDSTAIKAAMRHSKGTEEDKNMLDYLMKDNFISDIASGDPFMSPIRLPLDINFSGLDLKVKTDKIKDEIIEEPESKVDVKPLSMSTALSGHTVTQEDYSVGDLLKHAVKSEKGDLIFLQFPDTLPGLPPSVDERPSTSNSSNSNKEDELSKRLAACQLKDCNEGYMGKLRIRKSGKAELVLGDIVMEVMPGIPINFHQELVSIKTEHHPGQMIALGTVAHKLVVTPDYNQLLSHVDDFL